MDFVKRFTCTDALERSPPHAFPNLHLSGELVCSSPELDHKDKDAIMHTTQVVFVTRLAHHGSHSDDVFAVASSDAVSLASILVLVIDSAISIMANPLPILRTGPSADTMVSGFNGSTVAECTFFGGT